MRWLVSVVIGLILLLNVSAIECPVIDTPWRINALQNIGMLGGIQDFIWNVTLANLGSLNLTGINLSPLILGGGTISFSYNDTNITLPVNSTIDILVIINVEQNASLPDYVQGVINISDDTGNATDSIDVVLISARRRRILRLASDSNCALNPLIITMREYPSLDPLEGSIDVHLNGIKIANLFTNSTGEASFTPPVTGVYSFRALSTRHFQDREFEVTVTDCGNITVCKECCFTTIQEGINNASEGYTVIVTDEEIYNESVEITKDNITLDCQGTTIDGRGGSRAIFIRNKTGIVIRNCVVTNASNCIHLYQSNSSTIRDNEIFDCTQGIYIQGTYFPYDCFDNIVLNNTLRDNEQGIVITRSHDSLVKDNLVTGSSLVGINVGSLTNVLDNNTVVDNEGIGIAVNNADFIMANNTIVNNSYGIDVGKPYNQTQEILLNNITLNRGNGIYVNHASPAIINNAIYDNNGSGIYLQQAKAMAQPTDITYVIGNTLVNNTLNGIYAESGGKYLNISENNIFYNSLRGIWLESRSNVLENNLITGNGDAGIALISTNSYNNTIISNTLDYNGKGFYAEGMSTGNTLNNNHFCFNNQYDIYDEDATTGDNNTCDTTYNYNDTNTTGCTYFCRRLISRHRMDIEVNWTHANQSVTIRIFGRNGKPLRGADVDIYFEGKRILSLDSDEDGIVEFVPTREGKYEIEIEKTRYRKEELEIDIRLPEITTSTSTTTTSTSTTSTMPTSTSITSTTTTSTSLEISTTSSIKEEIPVKKEKEGGYFWITLVLGVLIVAVILIVVIQNIRKR